MPYVLMYAATIIVQEIQITTEYTKLQLICYTMSCTLSSSIYVQRKVCKSIKVLFYYNVGHFHLMHIIMTF